MMGSGTTLETSGLRPHAKGAYQSSLAWNGKKSFFLFFLENITLEIPQDLSLFFCDTKDPIEHFYVTSRIC